MKSITSVLALALCTLVAPAAMAASTFNLFDNTDPGACTQDASNAGTYGNQYTCSQQSTSADELAVRAYSTTGAGGKFAAAYVGDYDPNGFGATFNGESTGSPQHAVDNNGKIDALLFSFDSSIALTQLTLGWYQTDSDYSVYAWTASSGNAVTDLGNSSASALAGGWTLVGSYADSAYNTTNINGGAISSSYWLVSAYNSATGGGQGWSAGNDYFKLKSVAGNFTCTNSNDPGCPGGPVPEPASLALVGAALLGVFGTRRRSVAKRS